MNDLIRGEYLPDICDMRVGTESLTYQECLEIPDRRRISMYAKTDHLATALAIIKNYPTKLFTLVTHNSDYHIGTRIIPPNVEKWFAMNLNVFHPNVYSFPIGLENEYWHPHKQQILDTAPTFEQRKIEAFAQFNPVTHPQERAPLMNDLRSGEIKADTYGCLNGTDYELFVENLRKYAFCICPRGNGIDTHRMWEALYMGCIPIVKPYLAHRFDIPLHHKCKPLPILYVDNWKEITPDLLQRTYDNIDKAGFESKLLSMTYWKKLISELPVLTPTRVDSQEKRT